VSRFTKLAQAVAHTGEQACKALIEILKHLTGVCIGTTTYLCGFVLSLLQETRPLSLDRIEQTTLFKRLLNPCLGLAKQAVLLLNNTTRLLQLLRNSDAQTIDDIEYTLLIDKQATAKRNTVAFGKHILDLVD
jgi:hypothetical protein